VTPSPTLSITPAISAAGENAGLILSLHHQNVEEVQRSSLDRDHDLTGTGNRIRKIAEDEIGRFAPLRADDGLHEAPQEYES
jgi:hypothetical protein